MLTPTRTRPVPTQKNSLTITLTEPLVVLRTVNVARVQSQSEAMSPPSMLRGLLALDLAKASKISSIDVELQVVSCARWAEGMFHGVFFPFEFVSTLLFGIGTLEEHKIYDATQVFFRAALSPSTRRCISVDPGAEPRANRRSPSPPETERALQAPVPIDLLNDACRRGRMRVRRCSSADHLVFQRDPVERLNRPPAPSPLSFPPAMEEEVATHTPASSHVVQSPHTSTSSIPLFETPTPPCRSTPPRSTSTVSPSYFDRHRSPQYP
jgi:arrestin-related trafficking adapter 3/6